MTITTSFQLSYKARVDLDEPVDFMEIDFDGGLRVDQISFRWGLSSAATGVGFAGLDGLSVAVHGKLLTKKGLPRGATGTMTPEAYNGLADFVGRHLMDGLRALVDVGAPSYLMNPPGLSPIGEHALGHWAASCYAIAVGEHAATVEAMAADRDEVPGHVEDRTMRHLIAARYLRNDLRRAARLRAAQTKETSST